MLLNKEFEHFFFCINVSVQMSFVHYILLAVCTAVTWEARTAPDSAHGSERRPLSCDCHYSLHLIDIVV